MSPWSWDSVVECLYIKHPPSPSEVAQSCPTLCEPMDCSLLHPWDFPGKSTGVDCHFLLQRIFLTQGSNLGFLHCRQTLYCLSHKASPAPNRHTSLPLPPVRKMARQLLRGQGGVESILSGGCLGDLVSNSDSVTCCWPWASPFPSCSQHWKEVKGVRGSAWGPVLSILPM